MSLLVINTRGQVVRTVRSAASDMLDIQVSDLSKGIYFVEVNTGGTRYTQRIMKD